MSKLTSDHRTYVPILLLELHLRLSDGCKLSAPAARALGTLGHLSYLTIVGSKLELHLRLSDGCELSAPAARALGTLGHLSCLTIVGGKLAPSAAMQLLVGLASTSGRSGESEGGLGRRGQEQGGLGGLGRRSEEQGGLARGSGSGELSVGSMEDRDPSPLHRALSSGSGDLSVSSTDGFGAAYVAPGADAGAVPRGGRYMGGLRQLTILPQVGHGLGDEEMEVLSHIDSLQRLEFRSNRLTSRGLALLANLSRIQSLAICSLDSDSGYELGCLRRMGALQHLSLALEEGGGPLVNGSAATSLALQFRWTERAAGLLRTAISQLTNLRTLDMGVCRVNNQATFEAVAQLTNLQDLRMAVYSNSDTSILCDKLTAMRNFLLAKQPAYYPQQRRFFESNISVTVTAPAMAALAQRWPELRELELRLALSPYDYTNEGLVALGHFSALEMLALSVERCPAPPSNGGPVPNSTSASMPAYLDLMLLPSSLTSLELHQLHIHLSQGLSHSRVLSNLANLDLEACVLRSSHLLAIAGKAHCSLAKLRLSKVVVTQASLCHLSKLKSLKSLVWNTDDLTASGPNLHAFTIFKALRVLTLSCTRRTINHVVPGGFASLQQCLPYAHIEMAHSSVPEREVEEVVNET
eukprot:gene28078-31185_t